MPTRRVAEIAVGGMQCEFCPTRVEKTLIIMKGVIRIDVDYSTQIARVTYDADEISARDLILGCPSLPPHEVRLHSDRPEQLPAAAAAAGANAAAAAGGIDEPKAAHLTAGVELGSPATGPVGDSERSPRGNAYTTPQLSWARIRIESEWMGERASGLASECFSSQAWAVASTRESPVSRAALAFIGANQSYPCACGRLLVSGRALLWIILLVVLARRSRSCACMSVCLSVAVPAP
eukprot:GHVU01157618.1.p1 GENE.GHVU01157618.1~~GHVU01157618.1.p1  ORF type:complete len:236 (+),score=13.14 GHVU01157618.1:827-1534(+)